MLDLERVDDASIAVRLVGDVGQVSVVQFHRVLVHEIVAFYPRPDPYVDHVDDASVEVRPVGEPVDLHLLVHPR